MTPHELYQALLKTKGLSDTSLARELRRPSLQPTLSRFRSGETKDPRQEWVELVAKYFNVPTEAFRSDQKATEVAAALGLDSGESRVRDELPRRRKQAGIDPGMLVLQLADVMRPVNAATREAAAALLSSVVRDPAQAPVLATRMRNLLAPIPGQNAA